MLCWPLRQLMLLNPALNPALDWLTSPFKTDFSPMA
jgi:hypothetical protein